ncbi:PQQ-binding-like beta-propeller repeat protein [Halorubrum sp. DTA98]|uniref:outer membrane protein assembly factor BamB family protein n=1 Tax=Halorubrum sp. DTA98 TaxID=3402163 RepID=UPI003AAE75F7
MLDRYDRTRSVVSVGLLAVLVVPVVWNAAIWVRLGTPDVVLGGVVETIAPVAVAGVVALLATSVDVDVRNLPRPDRESAFSVVFSVLMVTSMVGGVAFVGTQPFGGSEHEGTVKAESPDDHVVYSGSSDNTVKALDAETGDEIWTSTAHSDSVEGVSSSPSGDVVYSSAHDNTVKALDAETGDEIWSSSAHSDWVSSVSPSPSGGVVFSGSADDTVKALDAETGDEIWSSNTHSDTVEGVSSSPSGDVVYSASSDYTVKALDAETGATLWTSGHSTTVYTASPSPSGDVVYIGTSDGEVKALGAETGDEIWSSNPPGYFANMYEVSPSPSGGVVYSGSFDEEIYALDTGTGDTIWSSSVHGSRARTVSASPNGGVVYSGSNDNTVKALDAETGDEIWTSTAHSDAVGAVSGESPYASPESTYTFDGWEDTAPLLRAVDQNGDPVHNATIEAWSVDVDQVSDEIEDKEAEAERILDEVENVEPEDFRPPQEVDITYGDLTDLFDGDQPDGVYPTAHTEGDMGIAGWADTHDLIPRLEFESGETVYLYAWDATEGANMGLTSDGVTSEHYGAIADDPTFTITKLGPSGETMDHHNVTSTSGEAYSGGVWPASYEHDYATADLPDGYYMVEVAESDAPGYVIKVGEATDVLTSELRDEADQLTEQAEMLQSYLGEDTLMRDRVNATKTLVKMHHEQDGIPPIDMSKMDYGDGYVNPGLAPSGSDPTDLEPNRQEYFPDVSGSEIYLQGYKGPDVGIDDFEDQDAQDIMELAQSVDGTIYASTEPKRVDLSEYDDPNNATIEVELHKFGGGLNPDIETHENRLQDLADQLLNDSTAELESAFRDLVGDLNLDDLTEGELKDRFEELEERFETNTDLEERIEELRGEIENPDDMTEEELREQLEDMERAIQEERADDLQDVVEQNQDLKYRVEELTGELESVENASDEDLQAQLAAMEQALADMEQGMESGPPNFDIVDGALSGEVPFMDALDEDATAVILHYEDGSSRTLSDDYWSVESGGLLDDGDTVVVDEFPVPDDRAVADVDVRAVSQAGAIGQGGGSALNPAFEGEIPDVDAIDVSTLRPGVDESVGIVARSSDDSFGATEGAQVYGPDGSELNVTQNNERVRFTPETAGTHTVRLTYSNDIGGEFTETFRISAKESPTSNPATLRVTDGIGGDLVLAGDGLESGSLDMSGDEVDIVAQAPGDESPSTLDIRAEQLRVDAMNVNVVQGSDQRSVDRHVSLRVYANFDAENALVHRDAGQPITASEDTRYGMFETRKSDSGDTHQLVETYTEADGTTTVQVNRNPSIFDRALYQLAIWGVGLPLSTTPIAPSDAILTMNTYTPAVDEATPGEVVSESAAI